LGIDGFVRCGGDGEGGVDFCVHVFWEYVVGSEKI
jgi:hypothetical protein